MRRPALIAAISYAGGVLLAHRWTFSTGWTLVATVAVYGCVLAGYWRRQGCVWMGGMLGCLLFWLGVLRYECATEALPGNHLVRLAGGKESLDILCEVTEEPTRVRDELRAIVDVRRVATGGSEFATCGKALVRFRDVSPAVDYGDRIRLRLRLRRPEPARNPGAFDYRRYLERKGIYATGLVRRDSQVLDLRRGEGHPVWTWFVLPIRQGVRRAVDRNLSGGPAGLLKGVLLGEKRGVPEEVQEAFRRSGVNRVLAVSGLHVGLIAAAVFFGLRAFGIGRRGTGIATVCALLLYALVTGARPSVVRAAAMGSIAIAGMLLDRNGEGLNTLGAAALGILALRPQDLFDVGFQLSFAATGGILVLYRPIRSLLPWSEKGPWGKWVCSPLAVSVAAQAGTGPLVVTYFGQLAPMSLLANLLVVPMMGASVALGLVSVILAARAGPAATLVNGANWLVLKSAIGVVDLLSRPSWACVEMARPTATGTALYLCLLCLIVPEIRRLRAGRYLPVIFLVLANLWVWNGILNKPTGLEILVLDVGQEDSTFLRFPNGRTMIVDGGDRAKRMDMGERVLVPFLRYRGIQRIDVVIGSHPHNDHIGGLMTLLEQVEVGHYLDAGQPSGTWVARRIRELVQEKGIVYHQVAAGDSLLGLGSEGSVVLHPSSDYVCSNGRAPRGLNNTSIVMRLAYNGHTLLLTGDVEREADRDLLMWTDRLRADVLKAAHHGSRTSSTAAFLGGVRPALVVVSCGAGNKFGHPSPSVIRRYQEMGIGVCRTDMEGAISVDVNGEEIEVAGWID